MQLLAPLAFALVVTNPLAPVLTAQSAARPGDQVPDLTFPDFAHGDGRQRLADFRGQTVIVTTFADVWGGLGAAERALKLQEKHARDDLVVILTHVEAGGTFGDAAAGVDLAAWAMNRYPGRPLRICGRLRPTWDWQDLGMPPLYAVIGPDGALVDVGSMSKKPKGLAEAVEAAVRLQRSGWGSADEAAARALLYGRGRLGDARGKAPASLHAEIDAYFARRVDSVGWLQQSGEWLRAQEAAEALTKAAGDVAAWQEAVAAMNASFLTEAAERELALARKLDRLLRPVSKRAPGDGAEAPLLKFVEEAGESTVGARAELLAARVRAAAGIR